MTRSPAPSVPIAEVVIRPEEYTILIVDDQEETRLSSQLLLASEGYRTLTAADGAEALTLLDTEQIHLVIAAYVMPRMNGTQLVRHLRQRDIETPILLQTSYSGDQPPREQLRALNIQGYHDTLDGPDRLLLWVELILKAALYRKKARVLEQLKGALSDMFARFLTTTDVSEPVPPQPVAQVTS